MSKRQLSSEKLREIQMKQGNRGPGSRFGGLKEKPKDLKKSLKRLIGYISGQKALFIALVIAVIIDTLLSVAIIYVEKDLITSLGVFNSEALVPFFEINPDKDLFIKSIILLSSCYFTSSVARFSSNFLTAFLNKRITTKLRKDLFDRISYLPISYVDTHPHGDIMSRMTNDVDTVTNSISSSFTSLISGVIMLVGCLVLMIVFSPLLTLVSFGVLILTVLLTSLMSKYLRPLFVKQQTFLGILNSETEEMVSGCKTVIAYNHQDEACESFNESSEELTKTGIKAQIIGGSMGPMMNFIGNLGYFATCFFGALFISKGIGGSIAGEALTIATVIAFLRLTKQFTRPINEIAQLYTVIINALAAAERVFGLVDQDIESFDSNVKFDINSAKGNIDFNHIAFGYVKEKQVLKDFNVDVRSGHKIALVGATGSGKTTVVNLLLRFYDVDSGSIKIDGVDIADISKKDLREMISIVLQDPILFCDTIENNIRYGKKDATDEEIANALTFANCDSFVNNLPEGAKTVLTEGATNISQGQRQLLTIARAVIANPKILILDEATSSVDTRTEKHIQDAMVKLMADRTSIIIAHRLSTIQDADLIVVLDDGRVVEMGNHKELIELGGRYNKLYQTQFSGLDT